MAIDTLPLRYALSLCVLAAFPSFGFESATDPVSDPAAALKLKVEILNKAGTVKLDRVRAGDSVLVRLLPQCIDGRAFTGNLDFAAITLESGSRLFAGVNPNTEFSIADPVAGPMQRYAIFTRVPENRIEIVNARGSWTDPRTGRISALSGATAIRMVPAGPERVVFKNPASTGQGGKPAVLIPGVAFACTVLVCDRFGNTPERPVEVLVKCVRPEVAEIVGGKPDLLIGTDGNGVGTFMVRLTAQAKENDAVRLYAEIVGEDSGAGKRSAWAEARCMRAPEGEALMREKSGMKEVICSDAQGRKILFPASMNKTGYYGNEKTLTVGKTITAWKICFRRISK